MRLAGSLFMMFLLFALPQQTQQAAREALLVWGMDVIPSLFPYMVLCKTLSVHLQSLNIPPLLTVSLLGMVGGSPSGAAVLSTYADNRRLNTSHLPALCALTGTVSPMFLLSTLNAWFPDSGFCLRMFFANLLGAAASAWLIFRLTPKISVQRTTQNNAMTPTDAEPITQSVSAILNVGGCIVFFSVLSAGAGTLMMQIPALSAVLHAVLEIAGGMKSLSTVIASPVICAALTGFGGLSILSQNLLFLRPHGISFWRLLGISLLRACCCGGIMWLLEFIR